MLFCSLATEAVAARASTMIEWAHQREVAVSVDVSSSAVTSEVGMAEAAAAFLERTSRTVETKR